MESPILEDGEPGGGGVSFRGYFVPAGECGSCSVFGGYPAGVQTPSPISPDIGLLGGEAPAIAEGNPNRVGRIWHPLPWAQRDPCQWGSCILRAGKKHKAEPGQSQLK